eukprot:927203-Rhodomonas_salina.4
MSERGRVISLFTVLCLSSAKNPFRSDVHANQTNALRLIFSVCALGLCSVLTICSGTAQHRAQHPGRFSHLQRVSVGARVAEST